MAHPLPTYLRRLVPAALLAAAATLGGSAFGEPATACAVPGGEWDIGEYDSCVKKADDRFTESNGASNFGEDVKFCCSKSGGEWDAGQTKCVAPAAAESQPTMPGVAPPPVGATDNPAPPPPPIRNPGVAPRPGVIETFTPAPIG